MYALFDEHLLTRPCTGFDKQKGNGLPVREAARTTRLRLPSISAAPNNPPYSILCPPLVLPHLVLRHKIPRPSRLRSAALPRAFRPRTAHRRLATARRARHLVDLEAEAARTSVSQPKLPTIPLPMSSSAQRQMAPALLHLTSPSASSHKQPPSSPLAAHSNRRPCLRQALSLPRLHNQLPRPASSRRRLIKACRTVYLARATCGEAASHHPLQEAIVDHDQQRALGLLRGKDRQSLVALLDSLDRLRCRRSNRSRQTMR
jgi:hypothetical protein